MASTRSCRPFEASFPPGVQWRIDNNNAEDFRSRLALVLENGLLAIASCSWSWRCSSSFKLAFWVMTGMAISFIGGMLFLPSRRREHQHDLALRLL
jgi:hypothetical protein